MTRPEGQAPAAPRAVFDAVAAKALAEALEALNVRRGLIVSTKGRTAAAEDLAADRRVAGVFNGAAMHTPVEVTARAVERADAVGADGLVALGGGSAIGLAKALAKRLDLPQIAIPTTYAGSEATPILGETEGGRKTTERDPRLVPRVVIYDPRLVVGLPAAITVTSGLNAIAHGVEALYADGRTEATTARAREGLAAFAAALPAVLRDPSDLGARGATQRGAWACGRLLAEVGMALHHKLCHTLGGSFGLPHAETHAVILPYAAAYNASAVPDLLAPVSEIFEGPAPGRALWDFARRLNAPASLAELGFAQADIPRAAQIAVQNSYRNPREVTEAGLARLLQDAFDGGPPEG